MAKTPSRNQMPNESGANPSRRLGLDVLRLAALCGILVLVVLSFLIWRSIDRMQTRLDSRLAQIENWLADDSAELDRAAVKKQPTRRGPDPNRVYTLNTAGSPAKGPAGAPVTIVEFSEFQ